jgi:hypothetical protein
VFEDEDEQAFLQLWLEELGKLEEEEKDEHE